MQIRLITLAGTALIAAGAAVSACGGAAPAPSAAPTSDPTAPAVAADVTAGKAVFDQNCNTCHPGGDRGVGPALKGRNLSADRITRQVRNGGGSMPAFSASQISDPQLNDLVAYVQSLK